MDPVTACRQVTCVYNREHDRLLAFHDFTQQKNVTNAGVLAAGNNERTLRWPPARERQGMALLTASALAGR